MSVLDRLDHMFVGLASPEKIKEWSYGEVTKQETINYRTHKPEFDGLFCERIFGPERDFRCSSHCDNYNKDHHRFSICPECGVEVTYSRVRRERMGHIELEEPVVHSWYFRGRGNYISDILNIKRRDLEDVIYCSSRVVTDPGDTEFEEHQIISQFEYTQALSKYTKSNGYEVGFKTDIGARIIRKMLEEVDLVALADELQKELKETGSVGAKRRIRNRLRTVTAFIESGNRPEWMVLTRLPVLPPELRPMVQIDGGRFASSDINELYRKVINRNNRLASHKEIGSPDILLENGMRLLQEGVDELISNTGSRGKRPAMGNGNQPLKSLDDMLKGKRGRFRQNLLGKRVDYSGRSVIVAGPDLKMNEVGLPRRMAVKLFEPFIIREMIRKNLAFNARNAKTKIDTGHEDVWSVLQDVVKHHPVILNRAPTLHRLSIRAFEPKLIDGEAIELHPLVCSGFNADFDGDQMAVHVPISDEAQLEARMLMYSTENLIHPQNGRSSNTPNQDMILGLYYMSQERKNGKGKGKFFRNPNEVKKAYENGWVDLHSRVIFDLRSMKEDSRNKYIVTTPGKVIFNESLPSEVQYINDREITDQPSGGFDNPEEAEKMLASDINRPFDKPFIDRLIDHAYDYIGREQTVKMLDAMMNNGFKYALKGGLTFSLFDITTTEKEDVIEEAEEEIREIEHLYALGRITDQVRYEKVIEVWTNVSEVVAKEAYDSLTEEKENHIQMIFESGARGNRSQYRQLAAMRGLMSDPNGTTIETPITSNFSEGLTVYEYFTSTHGSRKGMVDTALKTADSGYLTRRLVDVAQTVIVEEEDCGTENYSVVEAIEPNIATLEERVYGRVLAEDVLDEYGEIIATKGTLVDRYTAREIAEGTEKVKIRTATACESKTGVCSQCYGINLATRKKVDVGEAVGVIAAQSIGEPGTQLTMRTFHTGGVAGEGDITQGLPRVEEVFEARKANQNASVLTHNSGVVTVEQVGNIKEVTVTETTGEEKARVYAIPYGRKLLVEDGDIVEKGDPLTVGSKNLEELTKLRGIEETLAYIIEEILSVYKSQGVTISEKHIEVIARQMAKKVRVIDAGDTQLRVGMTVDRTEVEEANGKLQADEKPAEVEDLIEGITAASLSVSSFLSAASFQETSSVLSRSAIEATDDELSGLKEYVISGRLIPAGTGYYSKK